MFHFTCSNKTLLFSCNYSQIVNHSIQHAVQQLAFLRMSALSKYCLEFPFVPHKKHNTSPLQKPNFSWGLCVYTGGLVWELFEVSTNRESGWRDRLVIPIVKVKFSLYLPCRHRGRVEVYLHTFLTSEPNNGEWSISRFGRFTPRETNSVSTHVLTFGALN